MFRGLMVAACAAALVITGTMLVQPTEAKAEVSIRLGVGDRNHGYRDYRRYDRYDDDDHEHHRRHSYHDDDCYYVTRRVPSYHWHDGHYGRHGYKVTRVLVCDD